MFGRNRYSAVVVTAGLVGASLVGVTNASGARTDSHPEVANAPVASQRFSWEWAGGSTATERTFTEAKYANQVSKIALKVKARPPRPSHKVTLKVFQGGKWQVHQSAKTSKYTGRARLAINPICTSGNWCNGTFKMKLVVARSGGLHKDLTVTFSSNGGGNDKPGVPPVSKPQILGALQGPESLQFDMGDPPVVSMITSAQALQDPNKHSQIVVDIAWDAPPFLASNPISNYWVVITDESLGDFENGYYTETAADQRSWRLYGPVIYAEKVPHRIAITVIAWDADDDVIAVAEPIYLDIGCDAYGPDTGAANPYRTLCEHDPTQDETPTGDIPSSDF